MNTQTKRAIQLKYDDLKPIYSDIKVSLNVLYQQEPFANTPAEELKSTKMKINRVVRYMLNEIVQHGAKRFRLLGILPSIDDIDETVALFTNNVDSVKKYIISYITRNSQSFGCFVALWDKPSMYDIFSAKDDEDQIYPVDDGMLTQVHDDTVLNDVADASFEQSRQDSLNQTFGEHNDHELKFITHAIRPRDEDNCQCLLCYEKSDYVCYDCFYPLCKNCILRLKHSTNKCPQCQFCPIHLQPIEGGDRSLESL